MTARRILGALLAALALSAAAFAPRAEAQAGVQLLQGGALPVVAGHVPAWITNGVVGDAGGPGNSIINSLAVTAPGLPFCVEDAPYTSPTGYHQLCFGADSGGSALISLGAGGGAAPLGFNFNLNGVLYPFPGAGNGNVLGPSSSIGYDVAGYNGTGGSLLLDLGPRRGVSVMDARFGAKCNGVTDDTTAINSAISYAQTHHTIAILPPQICAFAGQIVASASSNWGIVGAGGSGTSTLLYTGASTTENLIVVGALGTDSDQVQIGGFRIASSTKMTAGDAMYIVQVKDARLFDLTADGQFGGNHNLWNGFVFDSINTVHFDLWNSYVQNDGILAYSAAGSFVDLFLSHGTVNDAVNGIHVAGGVGGLYVDSTDDLLNGTNLLVDNSLSAATNVQQVILGSTSLIDTATNNGILVNMPTTVSNCQLIFGGWISASGSNNIYIQKAPSCRIQIDGHPIQFATDAGVEDDDTSAQVVISGDIHDNGTWGVNCATAGTAITFNGMPTATNLQSVNQNCANTLVNALSTTPLNPAGTTSTVAPLMMGLGTQFHASFGSTVKLNICGSGYNNTAGDGGIVQLRYGTGIPPANGAGASGTTAGNPLHLTSPTANASEPFCVTAYATGWVPVTNYWIDASQEAVGGGTFTAYDMTVTAHELH